MRKFTKKAIIGFTKLGALAAAGGLISMGAEKWEKKWVEIGDKPEEENSEDSSEE